MSIDYSHLDFDNSLPDDDDKPEEIPEGGTDDNGDGISITICTESVRTIPRSWLGFLSDYAAESLHKYLENTGAPLEVVGLVDALHSIAWLQEQDLPNAEELLGAINLQIAQGLHFLKADLSTPAGTMEA